MVAAPVSQSVLSHEGGAADPGPKPQGNVAGCIELRELGAAGVGVARSENRARGSQTVRKDSWARGGIQGNETEFGVVEAAAGSSAWGEDDTGGVNEINVGACDDARLPRGLGGVSGPVSQNGLSQYHRTDPPGRVRSLRKLG